MKPPHNREMSQNPWLLINYHNKWNSMFLCCAHMFYIPLVFFFWFFCRDGNCSCQWHFTSTGNENIVAVKNVIHLPPFFLQLNWLLNCKWIKKSERKRIQLIPCCDDESWLSSENIWPFIVCGAKIQKREETELSCKIIFISKCW